MESSPGDWPGVMAIQADVEWRPMVSTRDQPGGEMSFGDHLEDLRRRLIYALIGVGVMLLITLTWGRELVAVLCAPLASVLDKAGLPPTAMALGVTTGFSIYMKVSLIAALIFSAPWVLYQGWKFIAPGLYAGEQRIVATLFPLSAGMIVLGMLFLYYIMLPLSLTFMIFFATSYPPPLESRPGVLDSLNDLVAWYSAGKSSTPRGVNLEVVEPEGEAVPPVVVPVLPGPPAHPVAGQVWMQSNDGRLRVYTRQAVHVFVPLDATSLITPMVEIGSYVDFVLFMALGIAAAFQMPAVLLIAGWSKLIDPRILTKGRKYAVFVCFVLGAALTPAEPVSMFALALPLCGLFELGLWLMRWAYGSGPARSDGE
jgi:sec-independent protein translocase protein TatC